MLQCIFDKRLIYLFPFMLLFSPAVAQYEENSFVRYTVKEGLSDNYVTCLLQDDLGYLWIATDNGLNRFDGYSFKNYFRGATPLSLPSNLMGKLKTFGPDQLGIFSRGGFQLLNTKDFSVRNYFVPDSTALNTYRNAVWDAVQLDDQSFALSTGSGFYILDKYGKVSLRHDAYRLEDIGKKRIFYGRDIFQPGRKGYLVYVENNDLAYYDTEKKIFREISATEKEWCNFYKTPIKKERSRINYQPISRYEFIGLDYATDSIAYYDHLQKQTVVSPMPVQKEFTWESKITLLNDSIFLVTGGYTGFYLFRINRQTGKIFCNQKKLLPGYKIQCLFLDKEKRLWAGTSTGLLRQKITSPFLKPYFYPLLPADNSTLGFQNAYRYKNKLYVCRFSRCNGLAIIDTATMKVEKRIEFYGRDNMWNEINSIQMYHPDTLWLGTNAGILWFDTKSYDYGKVLDEKKYPQFHNQLAFLAPPRPDGYAWFCYILGGVAGRYNIKSRTFTFFTSKTQPALPFDKVKSIAYDAYGDVWIGGHSLARWNNQKQLFDTLITVYGGANKFREDILTLSADATGSLWLHNAENGLLEYRIKEKKFAAYTMNNGLPSETLQCFSAVIENTLWIGSRNHLTRFDINTKKSFVYDYRDGLPDESPRSRRIFYDSSRQLFYMFCKDYLVEFPLHQKKQVGGSNDIQIQELSVNNKSFFHPAEPIELTYKEKNLTLQFNIINFESPTGFRFEYRLNDAAAWTLLGTQRSIHLNELQPGKHVIQIRATDKAGMEKRKNFTISIQAPFWKTGWFMLSCITFLSGIFFLFMLRREQALKKAADEKLKSQRLQTDQLQYRLEMEQITNYFTSSVADKNNTDDILWDVARNLIGKLDFEDCMIYIWNTDKTKMVQKAGYGSKGSVEEIQKLPFDVAPGQGIVGYVMQTKEAVSIPDTSVDSRYRPDDIVRLSEICVPVIYNDELIAIIDSEHHKKNFFTQRHLQVMTTIAALIANKIKSIESETGLQQKELEVANLNQQLAKFEMKALHAQMNPHFIFNSLNSIRDMILSSENTEASHYLSKFAHLIRITLDQSGQSFISLRNTIDYLHRYIEMEQIRNANFNCRISADERLDPDETVLPPMLIQPFIENAIWHGMTGSRKNININLDFKKKIESGEQTGQMVCTIEDNGIGIDKSLKNKKNGSSLHRSIGISNIKDRIRLLNEKYDLQSSITIEDKSQLTGCRETGTVVTIKLPLQIPEE
jgi:ligand-binding sensor domain-containing protein/putative methionine-R-sulfoxide reductase with GAF domain